MWRSMVMIREGLMEILAICPPSARCCHGKIYNNRGRHFNFFFPWPLSGTVVVTETACCALGNTCIMEKNQGRTTMDIKTVKIDKPEDMNFILGQAHFIKTVEDIHEAIVNTAPQMKFGIAFCESSGPALVRYSGNNDSLLELAKKNALNIAAGHSFIIFIENGYPGNILTPLKNVPEVCRVFCATANPVE